MGDIAKAREAAVAATVDRIREIERRERVTPGALSAIRDELIALATRKELFRPEDFPGTEQGVGDRLYLLSIDENDRFALYLNRGGDEKDTPPHDHKTWAVVVGIEGQEHNKVYRRLDDGSEPEKGQVEVDWELTVEPGNGICLMPPDIHSIHMRGTDIKMHFHMYGIGIHRMVNRVKFDMETGTVAPFPPHPDIQPVPAAS